MSEEVNSSSIDISLKQWEIYRYFLLRQFSQNEDINKGENNDRVLSQVDEHRQISRKV